MNEISEQMVKLPVCPLDCPDTCSLQVAVEINEISKVKGSRVNPYTAGALIDADMKTDIVDGACYNETFVELQPL